MAGATADERGRERMNAEGGWMVGRVWWMESATWRMPGRRRQFPPAAYYLLPTTYHLPPTIHHLPPTTYHVRVTWLPTEALLQKAPRFSPESCQFRTKKLPVWAKKFSVRTKKLVVLNRIHQFPAFLPPTIHHPPPTTQYPPPTTHHPSNRKFALPFQKVTSFRQKFTSFPLFCHTFKDLHERGQKKVVRPLPWHGGWARFAKGYLHLRRCSQFSVLSTRKPAEAGNRGSLRLLPNFFVPLAFWTV